VRRAQKCKYRFYTALEILQCEGRSNMGQYTPFYPVLEAFGGNLEIGGPGASTEKMHVPHFPDDPTVGQFGSKHIRVIGV